MLKMIITHITMNLMTMMKLTINCDISKLRCFTLCCIGHDSMTLTEVNQESSVLSDFMFSSKCDENVHIIS